MNHDTQTLRTFVAVELPEAVLALLMTIQEELRASLEGAEHAVRWTRPQAIHLTLQFLGDIRKDQVAQVIRAVEQACLGKLPFSLNLGSLGAFPNTRRPRVLWVGLEGDAASTAALRALQQAVSHELGRLGFEPDKSFKPHLTLGRLREGAARNDLETIANVLTYPEAQPTFAATFEVSGVSLMESDLQPGGSVYTQLARTPLPPRA